MDINIAYRRLLIIIITLLFVILTMPLLNVIALAQSQFNFYPEGLEGNVIKIGVTVSLSGKYSLEGSISLCGLKAAVDWINENGGININGINYKLQLIYQDDGSNPAEARKLYQSFVEDGITLFIAPYGSDLIEAAEAGIRGYPVIMYSYMPVPDSVLKATMGDMIVNIASSIDSRAGLILDTAVSVDPAARIGVFYVNNPYGLSYLSHLTESASKRGLKVIYQRDYIDADEVKDAIYSIKSVRPDILVIVAQSIKEASVIVKELHDGGVGLKLLIIDGVASLPVFYTNLSSIVAENVVSVSEWEPEKGIYNPQAASSRDLQWYGPTEDDILEYHKKHCLVQPNWISMGAAASILLLAKALEDAGSMKFIDIKNAIINEAVMTFYGIFKVDDTGKQLGHTPLLVQWIEGEKKIVYPDTLREITLKYPAPNWLRQVTTPSQGMTATPGEIGGLNLSTLVIAVVMAIVAIVIIIILRRR